jgi:hypothetical protein
LCNFIDLLPPLLHLPLACLPGLWRGRPFGGSSGRNKIGRGKWEVFYILTSLIIIHFAELNAKTFKLKKDNKRAEKWF